MHRLRDDKSPTMSRLALYISLGCEFGILAALLWGPEQLALPETLLFGLLALGLVGVGLYYLLFRRTGTFLFTAEARLQDSIYKQLLSGDAAMRKIALANQYDEWAHRLLGWSLMSCGAIWLILPRLNQLTWLAALITVGEFVAILGLIVVIKVHERRLRTADNWRKGDVSGDGSAS